MKINLLENYKLKELIVDDTTLIEKEDKVTKTFYTQFNFLKAIPFKMDKFCILFQVGNNDIMLIYYCSYRK